MFRSYHGNEIHTLTFVSAALIMLRTIRGGDSHNIIQTTYTRIIKFFFYQLMHKSIVLKNNLKICIKIDIKTAPTCFGAVTPPSGSALLVLAKVIVV
jgi:hypothetical protein